MLSVSRTSRCLTILAAFISAVSLAAPKSSLEPGTAAKIDAIANSVLTSAGVPSASLVIVRNGDVAYVKAYGKSRLDPPRDAEPTMRYAVGSISKQFTAAAVLLLVEEGKLHLEDTVSKFFPDLTRASDITLRMLLSHTSGYSDYWPEDYVMQDMLQPIQPAQIIAKWAKRPLDFEPGTKWEYSNTNYVIAGQIVEKVSDKPLITLLDERIFKPLQMQSVFDVDKQPLPESDAAGYYRHALGPLRIAPKEGRGWLSAAGELSMQPEDLARWDISLLNRSVLKPSSYDEMFKEVKTKDGKGTSYGLGVSVSSQDGHQYIKHSGEVSGFVAQNTVILDKKSAIIVLTNEDANGAAQNIAKAIEPLLIGHTKEEERALGILLDLQNGKLDRSQFTVACNAYFTPEAIDDFSSSLKPLGEPLTFRQTAAGHRGGMTYRAFLIHFPDRDLTLTTYEMPDGKLEQFLVATHD